MMRFAFVVLLYSLAATVVNAVTINSLIEQERLLINYELVPEQAVIGQEVSLRIHVLTDRWFAGGTRFKLGQADDVLVIQRQELAVNSSEKRQGESWVKQTWEFSVFPQKEGFVALPDIEITLSINTESGAINGRYRLPAISMEARLPAAMNAAPSWIAAKNFTADVSIDKRVDALNIGDAFTVTISFRADNVLAMMLPEVSLPEFDGLAIYKRPPVLKNDSNRGNKIATRVETIDVVVEKQGHYQLPELVFHWWNVDDEAAETLVLDAVDVSTKAGAVQAAVSTIKKAKASTVKFSGMWLVIVLVFIVFIAWMIFVFVKNRPDDSLSLKSVQKHFDQAVAAGDAKLALRWAYYFLDHHAGDDKAVTLRQYVRGQDDVCDGDNRFFVQINSLFKQAFFHAATVESVVKWDFSTNIRRKPRPLERDVTLINPR